MSALWGRPIVSCTEGPPNTASAYLDRLLQPHMRGVKSYLKNSSEVVNILSDLTFPQHVYLATLDIENLYTNITHTRAIHVDAFTRRFKHHPKFLFLLDLLKFVLGSNVFEFDGVPFKQKCGLAMGTRLAPAMATIVMGDLEEPYLDQCTHQPLLWVRYIDDMLVIWPHSGEHFQDFVEGLNTMAPRIKFTYTLSRTAVNFLDLTIYMYKNSKFSYTGKLCTKIYYKPTNTFNSNHGNSFVPEYVHRGTAMGEAIRILRNMDDGGLFRKYRRKLAKWLIKKGYGRNTINRVWGIKFQKRDAFLKTLRNRRELAKPLPLNTPFYHFQSPLRGTINKHWFGIYDYPHTTLTYPTTPFPVYKTLLFNIFSLSGRMLSWPQEASKKGNLTVMKTAWVFHSSIATHNTLINQQWHTWLLHPVPTQAKISGYLLELASRKSEVQLKDIPLEVWLKLFPPESPPWQGRSRR